MIKSLVFSIPIIITVVYYATIWATFRPKLEKMKILPIKNSYFILIIFRKKNFLAPKNLIKLFYALNKTPIVFTGCSSIQFFLNSPPFSEHSQATLGSLKQYIFKITLSKKIDFLNCSLKIYISKKYIFKIAPSKNTYLKIIFSKLFSKNITSYL